MDSQRSRKQPSVADLSVLSEDKWKRNFIAIRDISPDILHPISRGKSSFHKFNSQIQ